MLRLDVEHPLGRILLAVKFEAGPGLTAITGPSGSGKTSVLNVIAGFIRPRRAVVALDDDVLVDSARGIWRPPHTRRIGYVFQEPRLFPHLSVRHNVRYAERFHRGSRPLVTFADVVALLDLNPFLDRRPGGLSGGERQRVALGRALLSNPRLLLLDEPLAAVDVAKRQEVLPYLDRLRADLGLPTLYVTHTQSEIESRAERILTMADGRLV